jgi:hypothetical protein
MRRGLLSLLSVLACLVVPASASASQSVFENFSHGFKAPAQHPSKLYLDNQTALDMHWTNWGGSVTTGTGILPLSNCVPDCASGKIIPWPVTIRLSRMRGCEGNAVFYYTHMYLELPRRAKVGPIKETVTCGQALPHGAV